MSFGLEIILGRGKRRVRNEHLVLDLPDGGSLSVEHVHVDHDVVDEVETRDQLSAVSAKCAGICPARALDRVVFLNL